MYCKKEGYSLVRSMHMCGYCNESHSSHVVFCLLFLLTVPTHSQVYLYTVYDPKLLYQDYTTTTWYCLGSFPSYDVPSFIIFTKKSFQQTSAFIFNFFFGLIINFCLNIGQQYIMRNAHKVVLIWRVTSQTHHTNFLQCNLKFCQHKGGFFSFFCKIFGKTNPLLLLKLLLLCIVVVFSSC